MPVQGFGGAHEQQLFQQNNQHTHRDEMCLMTSMNIFAGSAYFQLNRNESVFRRESEVLLSVRFVKIKIKRKERREY